MSTYYIAGFPVSDELYHHGILGQKWGVRRYQNEDGSYTEAGKERYRYKKKDFTMTEKYIARKMDKSAAKSDKYEYRAINREQKTGKDTGIILNFYKKRGETWTNRLNTGTELLKSYRDMSLDNQRQIAKGKKYIIGNRPDDYDMEAIKAKTLYDMYKTNQLSADPQLRIDKIKKYRTSSSWY